MAPALRIAQHLLWIGAALALAFLAGCGGGGGGGTTACIDDPARDPRLPSCSGGSGTRVASLEVLVSSPQLPADGTSTVALTFRALDGNRVGIAGRPVQVAVDDPAGTAFVSNFSTTATAGAGTQHPTDANGQLTATLSAGSSKANRTIAIRASVDGVGAENAVAVAGTSIRVTGANALGFGASTRLSLLVADAAGVPLPGVPLTIASTAGNALSPASGTTDANGTLLTTVTGSASGKDTITASALGATGVFELTVSNDNFSFTTPATGTVPQVPVNVPQLLVVRWTTSGGGVPGATVKFQTTRGTLSASQAVTAANGEATVAVSSPFPGPAIVTATASNGALTATSNVLFVATAAAAKIDLQADRTTVATNPAGSTANVVNLLAVVRDPMDNLVSGARVTFQIEQDTSGGALTAAAATTDGNGLAKVQYVPSSSPSSTNGVTIRATLRDTAGNAVASATVVLTVGGQRLFVRIGTDNSIQDVPPNYVIKYSAFVTDAAGNPVPNAAVQFLLRARQDVAFDPTRTGDAAYTARFLVRDVNPPPGLVPTTDYAYFKGYWAFSGAWGRVITARCFNEDANFNGIRDAGEDMDGDGKLEPGNPFSVAQTQTTNAAGFATAEITYPQDRALWLQLTLKATAQVAGTEASESATFLLPIAADDLDPKTTPPGLVSPFGRGASCSDPN